SYVGEYRRQSQGDDLHNSCLDPAPERERGGRRRHDRLRGRPPRLARRGRLLRLEVRPGRSHPRARPRAARAWHPLHERLPGRRRHGLRARRRLRAPSRGAGRDDVGGRRGGGRPLLSYSPAPPPDPRDGPAAGDGAIVGLVRFGILSTAHINRLVIPGAHASEKVELIAVASREQSRAQEYAREWELERAYGSYDALLEDPDVEAVYISLPNTLHCEWSIRAVEAGKHVLCEK